MRKNEELTAASWKRVAIIERENKKIDEMKWRLRLRRAKDHNCGLRLKEREKNQKTRTHNNQPEV